MWESTFIDQNNPKRQTAGRPPMGLTEAGPTGDSETSTHTGTRTVPVTGYGVLPGPRQVKVASVLAPSQLDTASGPGRLRRCGTIGGRTWPSRQPERALTPARGSRPRGRGDKGPPGLGPLASADSESDADSSPSPSRRRTRSRAALEQSRCAHCHRRNGVINHN